LLCYSVCDMKAAHLVAESNFLNGTDADVIDWDKLSKSECKALNGKLFGSGCKYTADVFMFSCLLFIGTFIIAMSLKFFRNTRFFPNMVTTIVLTNVSLLHLINI